MNKEEIFAKHFECKITDIHSRGFSWAALAALEEYDVRTEKYLNEEFGVNYFSSELQNMDSDFSFYNQVLTAIDNY